MTCISHPERLATPVPLTGWTTRKTGFENPPKPEQTPTCARFCASEYMLPKSKFFVDLLSLHERKAKNRYLWGVCTQQDFGLVFPSVPPTMVWGPCAEGRRFFESFEVRVFF